MRTRFVLAAVLVATIVALVVPAVAVAEGTWRPLGEGGLTASQDMDTVQVNVRRGDFQAIKLIVRNADVRFREVVLHFAQGKPQAIAFGEVVAAGAESRPLAITGGDRVIRAVELRYDAASFQGKAPRVAVYGEL
jgi:hypothetical protein